MTQTTMYTVQDWQGGHANVGHRAPRSTAPATKTVRRDGRTFSKDGRYWYLRDNGWWGVRALERPFECRAGEWLHEEDDRLGFGFATLRSATIFTHARDEAAEQDRVTADAIKARIRRADLDAEPVDDGESYSADTDLAQGR